MTRIFGGGIGFILSITGWWFTLWLWTPAYGDMFRQVVLVPILGVFGFKDLAVWFAGKGTPLFVSTLIAIMKDVSLKSAVLVCHGPEKPST